MNAPSILQSGDARKFRIFRARESVDPTDTMIADNPTSYDKTGLATIVDGATVKVLFEDQAVGISLTYTWFKANFPLPRHSHNVDCLYYIVSGQIQMGSEVLKAGDGFFVPADSLYSYQAGPDGVEVVEFRTAVLFDIKFRTPEAVWKSISQIADLNREAWHIQPPPTAARRIAGAE